MCTAATYKTKDFYMGRTLDYEFSYGEQITITPRNYEFDFRFAGKIKSCSGPVKTTILGPAKTTNFSPTKTTNPRKKRSQPSLGM